MKIYKTQKTQVLDKIICDICNNECKNWERATLEAVWGYYSNKDGSKHECEMCESCFDKVKDYIESIGGKIPCFTDIIYF